MTGNTNTNNVIIFPLTLLTISSLFISGAKKTKTEFFFFIQNIYFYSSLTSPIITYNLIVFTIHFIINIHTVYIRMHI